MFQHVLAPTFHYFPKFNFLLTILIQNTEACESHTQNLCCPHCNKRCNLSEFARNRILEQIIADKRQPTASTVRDSEAQTGHEKLKKEAKKQEKDAEKLDAEAEELEKVAQEILQNAKNPRDTIKQPRDTTKHKTAKGQEIRHHLLIQYLI